MFRIRSEDIRFYLRECPEKFERRQRGLKRKQARKLSWLAYSGERESSKMVASKKERECWT